MYTELNRAIPTLFLANDTTGEILMAKQPDPREERAATHDFLLVMPLRDFAASHTSDCDPAGRP